MTWSDLPDSSSLAPLLTDSGWELLQAWEKRSDRTQLDPLTLGSALRDQGIPAATVSAVLTQLALRDHAESKFGSLARHMVFTRDGLEQATRFQLAALHAQRFVEAGCRFVADLGCGLGTESLALAGLGVRTLSVDIDPEAIAAAAINLRDFPQALTLRSDVNDLDFSDLRQQGVDAIFADPARRTGASKGGTRINDPESWMPPLSTVLNWRKEIPAIGIKVAPGIRHEDLPADLHAQWTSIDGSLVEAALWSPELAQAGSGRSAQIIQGTSVFTLSDNGATTANACIEQAPDGPLERYIAEPDDAVIRSGALAHLAHLTGMHLVDPRIAYLTGNTLPTDTDHQPITPFLQVFEVLEVTPLRAKHIASALHSLGVTHVEVKKRGADIDPAALRRSLKLAHPGDTSKGAVIIATRLAGKHRAIIAKRLHTHS